MSMTPSTTGNGNGEPPGYDLPDDVAAVLNEMAAALDPPTAALGHAPDRARLIMLRSIHLVELMRMLANSTPPEQVRAEVATVVEQHQATYLRYPPQADWAGTGWSGTCTECGRLWEIDVAARKY